MFRISLRLTGATQFVATSAIATFQEVVAGDTYGVEWAAVIKWYEYNSQGSAHTVNLTLRPTWNSNADEQMVLEAPTDAVNNFTYACGPTGGIVVPRRYGIEATAQPVAPGFTAALTSYNLYFTTVGKDNAATLALGYQWERVGGAQ